MQLTATKAKPFLKWAGGKAQLIEQIVNHLPNELKHGKLHRCVEPFVGGGALFCKVSHVTETQLDILNEKDLCFNNNTHSSTCA